MPPYSVLASPVCSEGVCATLMEDTDGDYRLSFTTYGEDPSKLPEELEYQAYSSKGVVVDELIDDVVAEERLSSDTDTLTAVFASELEIDGDPNGGDASGAVSLLGAADTKGKQATLSKGTFFGSFSHDSDGDLGLGGYGTDDWATSDTSNNVVLGEAVALTDREGNPLPPPAIQYGNGSGTKNASSQTSTRPELL